MTYKFLDLTGLKQTITQIFSKLKAVALSGSYTDLINRPTIVNNGTTTTTNTVLDGRMGKTLADKDANLQSQITSLNSSLTKSVITEQPESGNADRMMPQSNITKFYVISDSTGTLENNFPIAGAGLLISTNLYNIHYLQIFYPLSAKGIYLRGYRQNESWSQWAAIS